MDASGVKQTRKALEGGNRRGGAKPRGRNVPGEASPGSSGLPVLMASSGPKPQGRGRDREVNRRAARVIPWRGAKPHERMVVWSQATRRGVSKENLRAEQAGRIPRWNANGEEGRAQPMRHYTGTPITL
jgi:hypothetical protein